jgi:hypothetical protein
MPPELVALDIGAEPTAWRGLGFAVDPDGICRLGSVACRLTGEGRHLRRWTLTGVDAGVSDVDGLPTVVAASDARVEPADHPNGTADIDHVVVSTPDVDRTVAALGAIGLDVRRYRDAGTNTQQAFFRLGGPVILEVIGPVEPSGDGPARFFGLALNVVDLDATASYLGERLGRVKDAVQQGRRIATLHDKSVGTAIAFMSPGKHSVALIEAGQA